MLFHMFVIKRLKVTAAGAELKQVMYHMGNRKKASVATIGSNAHPLGGRLTSTKPKGMLDNSP